MGQMAETEQDFHLPHRNRVSWNKLHTSKLVSVEKTTVSAMLARTGGILKGNFMLYQLLLLLLLSLLLFFTSFTVLYKKQAFYLSFSVSNLSTWSYV